MSNKRSGKLIPKLILVCLGGWAMASFASIEAPAAIKLVTLEQQIKETSDQARKNSDDIAEIKKQINKDKP